MINERDRSQLLRMAGNVACGFVTNNNLNDCFSQKLIAEISVGIAYEILLSVDKLIDSKKDHIPDAGKMVDDKQE
jgi:hypothetical protein